MVIPDSLLTIFAINGIIIIVINGVFMMNTLNISLPDSMKYFINEQVNQGGYNNPSDYIRDLILKAQKKADQEALEKLLLEGLDSGESFEITDQWWEEKRSKLLTKLQEKS